MGRYGAERQPRPRSSSDPSFAWSLGEGDVYVYVHSVGADGQRTLPRPNGHPVSWCDVHGWCFAPRLGVALAEGLNGHALLARRGASNYIMVGYARGRHRHGPGGAPGGRPSDQDDPAIAQGTLGTAPVTRQLTPSRPRSAAVGRAKCVGARPGGPRTAPRCSCLFFFSCAFMVLGPRPRVPGGDPTRAGGQLGGCGRPSERGDTVSICETDQS